jgi:transposase
MPDSFWALAGELVPPEPRSPRGGAPPLDHRRILNGILYVLRTGCQWKMLPREYGSGSTAHRHFQNWVRDGVFARLWELCLAEYDDCRGIDWRWQSVDSFTVSAPVRGAIAPARIPLIAPSSGPNAICMSTPAVSRWP